MRKASIPPPNSAQRKANEKVRHHLREERFIKLCCKLVEVYIRREKAVTKLLAMTGREAFDEVLDNLETILGKVISKDLDKGA